MSNRDFADLKQEAVITFELENIYGFSPPIYYSEAYWHRNVTGGNNTWGSSTTISATRPTYLLASHVPTNVIATPLTTDSVRVTWTNATFYSSGAHQAYYRIYKVDGYDASTSNGGWTAGGSSTTTGTVDITGLQANTRYEFMVQSTSETFGWSSFAYCRTFLLLPAMSTYNAPSSLAGTAASTSQINLSWTQNNTGSSGTYNGTEVYRITGTGTPTSSDTLVSGAAINGASYNDTGLSTNTTYSYRARNKYNSGSNYSEWSNTITVTTQNTAPPSTVPTNLAVTLTGLYAITVDWTNNGGATNIYIQADYDGGSFSSPIYNVQSTTKPRSVTGLSSGTAYQFRASADGTNWSNIAYGTTAYYTGGDGGGTCVLETETLTFITPQDEEIEVIATDIRVGDRLLGTDTKSGKVLPAAVIAVLPSTSKYLYHIKTKSGCELACSDSHRIITSYNDERGLEAKYLKAGYNVLVYDKITKEVREDEIVDIWYETGEFNVITFTLDSKDHTYISKGILSHNRKPDPL